MAGNSNSGRRPLPVEMQNTQYLAEIFFQEHDLDELKAKATGKKRRLIDVYIAKAFAGSDSYLHNLFNKVFPTLIKQDNTNHSPDGLLVTPEQLEALASTVSRIAVELRPPDTLNVQATASGAEPPALRADVPAPLPDQPSPGVPPGDSVAPEGPAPAGDSPA